MTPVTPHDLAKLFDGAVISDLRRLSGGANMETWSFDALMAGTPNALILRRLPSSDEADTSSVSTLVGEVPVELEASLIELAGQHQVPVPEVVRVLNPEDGLGRGFIMTREAGEALPQKLLRDPYYEKACQLMPYQCGQAMAKIHQIPLASVPGSIPRRTYAQQLDDYQQKLDHFGNTSPVHQLALNWLKDHPPPAEQMTLVHGDFRNGNLLVDEQGLVAVLDWELAHVGHPWEDLGYFCANVWRFGQYDKPAGGFGSVEALLEGYASVAGDAPNPLQLKAWELMAALSWGLVTQTMYAIWQEGVDRRLERAAVGRRMSESEIDILLLLDDLEALS